MRTRLSRNPTYDFPHSKTIHSYCISLKLSKTPTLPTLLPTITLRKQAKQKGMQQLNCIPYRILSSDGFQEVHDQKILIARPHDLQKISRPQKHTSRYVLYCDQVKPPYKALTIAFSVFSIFFLICAAVQLYVNWQWILLFLPCSSLPSAVSEKTRE